MKETTRKTLDSLTPEMIDETVKKTKIKDVPDGISPERIKSRVLAATGLENKTAVKSEKLHLSARRNWISAAAAACVALIAVVLIAPSVFKGPSPVTPPGITPGPDNTPSVNTVKIDSLDKINYYAAEKMLRGAKRKSDVAYEAFLPSDASSDVVSQLYEFYDNQENANLDSSDVIVSFPLDPDEVYEIHKVIRFKINLTDPANPIAERLGTGIITVTITENTLMDMFTFEKDGKFFSVCDNTFYTSFVRFYSIKYIDGFNVCKLQTADYFVFDIAFDEEEKALKIGQINNITGFSISKIDYSENLLTSVNAEIVEGSVEMAEGNDTFTLRELEEFYSNAER